MPLADEVSVRPFGAAEWRSFRDFRLKALKAAPGVFSATYEDELARPDTYWQGTAEGNDRRQVFGLFDGSRLIGITAVFTHRGDATGETAILAMSFIDLEYRGRGLSRLLYQARLNWVRAHSHFKRVVVSHRESNEVSKRANQAFGFRYVGRGAHAWPDGVTEDELHYELVIPRKSAGPKPRAKAPRRSKAALEQNIDSARTDAERSSAHFALALFHDNNSREREAIPHYEEALRLGLQEPDRSEALAWLASSLYKTRRPAESLTRIAEAQVSAGPGLRSFLTGLEKRVARSLAASEHPRV